MPSFSETFNCPDTQIDLGRATLAIARLEYPGLDPEPYLGRMDRLAHDVRDLAGGESSLYRLMACINTVLFGRESYRGNTGNYYDPKNSFMNEVMERKLGIPISLSVLYMEVARRVGLTFHGVGFPGHFLVRCVEDGRDIVVDPFHGGTVRSAGELQELLDRTYGGQVAFRAEFLCPASNRQILKRMLNNLKIVYSRQGDVAKCLSVVDRLIILEPGSAEEIRDRGLLYLKLECFHKALDDLESYLRLAPDAAGTNEVRRLVDSVRKQAGSLH